MAAAGTLVYVDVAGGVNRSERTLVWVDRQGVETLLGVPPRPYQAPRLSPDGSHVALSSQDQEQDLWVWDLTRATLRRLTFDVGADTYPVWTADGRRIAFASMRGGRGILNLYIQAADGTGTAERLTESENNQRPTGSAPDGSSIVFDEFPPVTQSDIGLLTFLAPRAGAPARSLERVGAPRAAPTGPPDPQPTPQADVRRLLETRFSERNGIISPDGRWLAYESESGASGQFQVYVRPFPNAQDGQWQVSTAGGRQPLWARSGRELFYVGPDRAMFAVPIDARGTVWRAGSPERLFGTGIGDDPSVSSTRMYDVSSDGQRFLIIKERTDERPPQIVIIQNWFEELKRLVAAN